MKYKNLFLFAVVLFVLIGVRYVLAQDEVVGWPDVDYEDPSGDIFRLMMAAPILGAVFGALRILFQAAGRPILQPINLK